MTTRPISTLAEGDTVELHEGGTGKIKSIRRSGIFQTKAGRAYEIYYSILSGPNKGEHATEFYSGDTYVVVVNSVADIGST